MSAAPKHTLHDAASARAQTLAREVGAGSEDATQWAELYGYSAEFVRSPTMIALSPVLDFLYGLQERQRQARSPMEPGWAQVHLELRDEVSARLRGLTPAELRRVVSGPQGSKDQSAWVRPGWRERRGRGELWLCAAKLPGAPRAALAALLAREDTAWGAQWAVGLLPRSLSLRAGGYGFLRVRAPEGISPEALAVLATLLAEPVYPETLLQLARGAMGATAEGAA